MHPALQALLGGLLIGLASWLLMACIGKVAGISGIGSGLLSAGAACRVSPVGRLFRPFCQPICQPTGRQTSLKYEVDVYVNVN